MLSFRCPTCATVLKTAASQSGTKGNCPRCRQRLQVPAPPRKRTVLGRLVSCRGRTGTTVLGTPVDEDAPRSGRALWLLAAAALLLCCVAGATVWFNLSHDADTAPAIAAPEPTKPYRSAELPPRAERPPQSEAKPEVKPPLKLEPPKEVKPPKVVEPAEKPKAPPAEAKRPPEAKSPQPVKAPPVAAEPKKLMLTSAEIFARYGKSVALIRGSKGTGSGFIAQLGLVVTNAHVVEGQYTSDLKVLFPSADDKKPIPVMRLLYYNRKRDLAVLQVKTDLPALAVARGYEPVRGDGVTAIGSPGTGQPGDLPLIENSVQHGVFGAPVRKNGLNWYQLSISLNCGNSGCPIFDEKTGKVIGVESWGLDDKHQLEFCVPAEDVHKALDAAAACSPAEADALARRHNLRAALMDVDGVGQFYVAVFVEQAKILKSAGNPNPALRELERQLEPKFRAAQLQLVEAKRRLDRLVRKGELPEDTAADLHELAKVCRGMQRLIYEAPSPRYSVNGYLRVVDMAVQSYQAARRVAFNNLEGEEP
jgi:S1-C subfamily serine protease